MQFDYFIGKIKNEGMVTLALNGSTIHGYNNMYIACEDLINLVTQKKRILLTKAPDPQNDVVRNAGEALNELNATLEKILGKPQPVYDASLSHEFKFEGDKYEPFTSKELFDLRLMFYVNIKFTNYEDPFDYQPISL